MPCRHTYRPLTTLTLSLPTRAGVYEALVVYRCQHCRHVDAWAMALSNRRPMPSWAEVQAVHTWQQEHRAAARQTRKR